MMMKIKCVLIGLVSYTEIKLSPQWINLTAFSPLKMFVCLFCWLGWRISRRVRCWANKDEIAFSKDASQCIIIVDTIHFIDELLFRLLAIKASEKTFYFIFIFMIYDKWWLPALFEAMNEKKCLAINFNANETWLYSSAIDNEPFTTHKYRVVQQKRVKNWPNSMLNQNELQWATIRWFFIESRCACNYQCLQRKLTFCQWNISYKNPNDSFE